MFVERHHSTATVESPSSTGTNSTLEGVVAFLGPTQFAPGDDWVGVRLTGDSNGRGKNDGSVKGKRYFVCEANCGVFIRRGAVMKRHLNRIEELRLRRELGAAMLASAPASAAPPVEPSDTTSKAATLTPTTSSRRQSSLQKARSATKGQGGRSSRTPPSSRSASARSVTRKTPRPNRGESTPTKTNKPVHNTPSSFPSVERNGEERGGGVTPAVCIPLSARRLDQIRERKAALATIQNTSNTEELILASPPRNTRVRDASATSLLGEEFSTVVATEDAEANALKSELSSLRGQMIALQDENESLRSTLHAREAEMRESEMHQQSTNKAGACVSNTSKNKYERDSNSADSLDVVLHDGGPIPAATPQDISTSFAAPSSHGDMHPEGNYADLVAGIQTPAKPDLERRLAKALLKIALLQEAMDDLRSTGHGCAGHKAPATDMFVMEALLSNRHEEVSIHIPLHQVHQSDDFYCVPTALPVSLQGVIPSDEWMNFASEANEVIEQWATITTTFPYKAILIGICVAVSVPLMLYSDYVAASVVISGAVVILTVLSCRGAFLHRSSRSKLETLLNQYVEKWPGTTMGLAKQRENMWCCLCPTTLYDIQIASEFDMEDSPPMLRRYNNDISRSIETDLVTGNAGLDEPLLPANNLN